MKTTLVALLKEKQTSDNNWIREAKEKETLYTLREFERMCNQDEVNLEANFIRFVRVELEVKIV